jgi:hypothetical protein
MEEALKYKQELGEEVTNIFRLIIKIGFDFYLPNKHRAILWGTWKVWQAQREWLVEKSVFLLNSDFANRYTSTSYATPPKTDYPIWTCRTILE